MAKSNYQKVETFVGDSLEMLKADLHSIEISKEIQTTRKNILKRHGVVLGKREAEPVSSLSNYEPIGKRVKMGERFESHEEIFALADVWFIVINWIKLSVI